MSKPRKGESNSRAEKIIEAVEEVLGKPLDHWETGHAAEIPFVRMKCNGEKFYMTAAEARALAASLLKSAARAGKPN